MKLWSYVSASILGIYFLRSSLFGWIGLAFKSHAIFESFLNVWVVLVPLSISILIYSYSKTEKWSFAKRSTALLSSILIAIFFVKVCNIFHAFCGRSFGGPLYHSSSSKKVLRRQTIDCGALDSNPLYEICVTEDLGPWLYKYAVIDEENIDTTYWIKEKLNF